MAFDRNFNQLKESNDIYHNFLLLDNFLTHKKHIIKCFLKTELNNESGMVLAHSSITYPNNISNITCTSISTGIKTTTFE